MLMADPYRQPRAGTITMETDSECVEEGIYRKGSRKNSLCIK